MVTEANQKNIAKIKQCGETLSFSFCMIFFPEYVIQIEVEESKGRGLTFQHDILI